MANYGRPASLSQTSDDNSSGHSPRSFPVLSGNSPIITGGTSTGYISFPRKNKQSSPPIPISAPPQPQQQQSPHRVLPSEPEEQPPTKKRRGRPLGSKNKPKPPVIIREDSGNLLKPVIIEIPPGNDIVNALIKFSRRRRVGISILSGTGLVSEAVIRHPASRGPMSLHGPYQMLSLSGSYMNARYSPLFTNPPCSSFGIYLSGSQGQLFGGTVAGAVIAASVILVVASVFKRPEYHRAPFINGNVDVGEDEPFIGVVTNSEAHPHVHVHAHAVDVLPANVIPSDDNNNNNNNISAYGNVASTSARMNFQVPNSVATDHVNVNVMQWNHSTRTNANY